MKLASISLSEVRFLEESEALRKRRQGLSTLRPVLVEEKRTYNVTSLEVEVNQTGCKLVDRPEVVTVQAALVLLRLPRRCPAELGMDRTFRRAGCSWSRRAFFRGGERTQSASAEAARRALETKGRKDAPAGRAFGLPLNASPISANAELCCV